MNKWVRRAAYGAAGLVATGVVAAGGLWGASHWRMGETAAAGPERIVTAGADAARGRHLLETIGCTECHGETIQGHTVFDDPSFATINAPNLTQVAARATDQQLAAAIRQGVGHDGRALRLMPSATYAALTDREVGDLLAAIRAAPRGGDERPVFRLGPIGHVAMATGGLPTQQSLMAGYRARPAADLGPRFAAGRHIAMSICADCHGSDLTGHEPMPGVTAPDLTIAGSYDAAQFAALMKTGTPPGGRELQMMSETSRKSFSRFTDAEVAALFAYLQARAAQKTGAAAAP